MESRLWQASAGIPPFLIQANRGTKLLGQGPTTEVRFCGIYIPKNKKVCPHKAKNDLYKLFYIVTRKCFKSK